MKHFIGFNRGLWLNNPVLALNLGLCPVLAVSTSVYNAFWMSMVAVFVLTTSCISVSIIRNIIPWNVRIPVFMAVIVTVMTVTEMALNAYRPDIYGLLGIYLPILAVNCLILGKVEEHASRNGVIASGIDSLGTGLGFSLVLIILASLREISGTNSILGHMLIEGFEPASVMIMAPGGFIILGLMLWLYNTLIRGLKNTDSRTRGEDIP